MKALKALMITPADEQSRTAQARTWQARGELEGMDDGFDCSNPSIQEEPKKAALTGSCPAMPQMSYCPKGP
eukprot:1157234-Pelagomonas_calceolata.AAC.23